MESQISITNTFPETKQNRKSAMSQETAQNGVGQSSKQGLNQCTATASENGVVVSAQQGHLQCNATASEYLCEVWERIHTIEEDLNNKNKEKEEKPQGNKNSKKQEKVEIVDLLNEKLADLSERNRKKFRKECRPPNVIDFRMDNLHSELSKLKRNYRKHKRFVGDLPHAQILGIPLQHSLNEEQFSAVQSLAESMQSMLGLLRGVSDQLPQASEKAKEFAHTTLEHVGNEAVGGLLSGLRAMLEDAFQRLKKTGGEMCVIIVSSSILVYLLINGHDWKVIGMIMAVIGIVLKQLGLFDILKYATMLYDKCRQLIFKDEPTAQMFDPSTISDLVSSSLFVYMFPKRDISKVKLSHFFTDFGRITGGMESVVSLIMRMAQRIIDWGAQQMGWSSYTLLTSAVPKVDKWTHDARDFIDKYSRNMLGKNRSTYDRCCALEDRAYEILSEFVKTRYGGTVGQLVRQTSNSLSRIRVQMEQMGVGEQKARQPPLVIMLRGASQIGKSRSLRPLIMAILCAVLDPEEFVKVQEDYDSYVYSRQPEHEFWDGYYGQMVCFFDEFNVVNRKHLTANNAQMELIRAGNVFPYVLHMAGIEQKGNVYFRSKIVICTSNAETVAEGAIDAVNYPEAVVNRFHFECEVRLNKEYVRPEDLPNNPKSWRLDMTKVGATGPFNWDVHRLVLWKRMKKGSGDEQYTYVQCETLTLEEFVRVAAMKYRELMKIGEAITMDDVQAVDIGKRAAAFVKNFSQFHTEAGGQFLSKGTHVPKAQMDEGSSQVPAPEGTTEYVTPEEVEYDSEYDQSEAAQHAAVMGLNDVEEYPTQAFRVFLMLPMDDPYVDPGVALFGENMTEAQARELATYDLVGLKFILCRMGKVQKRPTEASPINRELLKKATHVFRPMIDIHVQDETLFRKLNYGSLSALKKHARPIIEGIKSSMRRTWDRFCAIPWGLVPWGITGTEVAMIAAASFVVNFVVFKSINMVRNVVAPPKEVAHAQLADPAVGDIATKIWKRNYYEIMFDANHVAWGFFLYDTHFVFCYHYVVSWQARNYGKYLLTLKGHDGQKHDFPVQDFFKCQKIGEDIAIVQLPKMRNHSDIRSLMLDTSYLVKRKIGDAMMIRHLDGCEVRQQGGYTVTADMKYVGPNQTLMRIPLGLEYNFDTRDGECGLPIFVRDPTTRCQKFVGMHVAGRYGQGFATGFEPEVISPAMQLNEKSFPSRTMEVEGRVAKGPGMSGRSAIVRSALYGAWGPAKKAKAHLRPFTNQEGVTVDPWDVALSRYDHEKLEYDPKLVSAAVNSAVSSYVNSSQVSWKDCTIISQDAAIFGIPGDPFMESLKRQTSPGWDWNIQPRPGYRGKERFFGKDVLMNKEGPDYEKLISRVERYHDMLKRGERPDFRYSDSLKDETLKIEKVEAGKTRPFCPCPIEYQILFNMYWKRLFQKLMIGRIKNECAVGINPYSDEWDLLRRRICRHGDDRVIAGDFQHFDSCQSAQILRAIGEALLPLFADREHDNVRRLLWQEVWDSGHVLGTYLVRWKQSLPSGHPATTLINCLFNSTIMRMAYVKIHNDDLISLRTFSDLVALTVYGDDNILGVSKVLGDKVTQLSLTKAMAKLGLVYTSEDKSSNPPPFRKFTEVEFLKRKFRHEPEYGRYCAPLRMETILEMPYWTKKEQSEGITCTNVDNAIRELALHPKEVYDEWVPKIVQASVDRLGYMPTYFDRSTMLQELVKTEIVYW